MYYLLFICRKVCFGFIFISISFNTRFFTFVCHGTWLDCSPCSPSSLLSISIIDKVTSRIIFKDLRSYLFFQLICIRILHTFTSPIFGANLLLTSMYTSLTLLKSLRILIFYFDFNISINSASSPSSSSIWNTIFSFYISI